MWITELFIQSIEIYIYHELYAERNYRKEEFNGMCEGHDQHWARVGNTAHIVF